MLIDTHAHLNFKAFARDRYKIAQQCLSQDVWLINASSNLATSKMAVEMANKFEQGVYAAVGLHPIHIKLNQKSKCKPCLPAGRNQNENVKCKEGLKEQFNYNSYKKLASSEKVVAVGETGLDYWQLPPKKQKQQQIKQLQKQILTQHIKLAQELNLPLIFHCRKAHQDLIGFLKNLAYARFLRKMRRGVIHCFTGNVSQLQQYLDMGLYIGFNGIIFKLNLDNVIKKTPLDRLLIETDCPFLTPPACHASQTAGKAGRPQFPEKRNNPLAVKLVAQKIAQIKKQSPKEITLQTTKNAQELFRIPKH